MIFVSLNRTILSEMCQNHPVHGAGRSQTIIILLVLVLVLHESYREISISKSKISADVISYKSGKIHNYQWKWEIMFRYMPPCLVSTAQGRTSIKKKYVVTSSLIISCDLQVCDVAFAWLPDYILYSCFSHHTCWILFFCNPSFFSQQIWNNVWSSKNTQTKLLIYSFQNGHCCPVQMFLMIIWERRGRHRITTWRFISTFIFHWLLSLEQNTKA